MQSLLLLFLFIYSITGLQPNLTKPQWSLIKSLLSHEKTTPHMRKKLNTIIFDKYRGWAKYKAYQYKKRNFSLCKDIKMTDFTYYAELGLYKSISSYNASYIFYKHAELYISYYLYIGLSELHPGSNLPHRYRVSKIWKEKNKNLYHALINPILFDTIKEGFIYDNNNIKKNIESEIFKEDLFFNIWRIVYMLDPLSFHIFTYKYDYHLKKMRTNKHVSELLCYSSEYIRQNLKKTIYIIQKKLIENMREY